MFVVDVEFDFGVGCLFFVDSYIDELFDVGLVD